ncbi:MAG: Uncharacterised protein [Cyanobium sp. ARS6]|nr:MAG: Uncharacterised protein [Cyanobium sp. ARS6]
MTLESGADALIRVVLRVPQFPAQAVSNPGSKQEALHWMIPFDIDVQLNHMAKRIASMRRIEDHGKGLMPAAEAQPVQIVDRLPRFNP